MSPCSGLWPKTYPLNESPSEKEGKFHLSRVRLGTIMPLNESPSEKEGKLGPAWSQEVTNWRPQ